MLSWLRIATLCLAIGAIPVDRPRRDPALEALAAETVNVAPEFAADVLLRIATSPKTTDLDRKRELLERAYQESTAVREPYRRTAYQIARDTRPGALVQAYDMRLDRVSLQVRIALATLPLDASKAREIFDGIDLHLNRGSCEDPLVPAADEYYNTLTQLARHLARGDADARARAFHFFILHLWRARLPSEMPAVVRAVRGFEPDVIEAIYLDGALRAVLEHAERDPQGFSASGLDLLSRMVDLAEDERLKGLTPSVLIHGLRRYLVNQLTGSRCDASATEGPMVATFNAILKRPGVASHDLKPLGPNETQPSKMLPSGRIEQYWQAMDARRLYEDLMRLWGTGQKPFTGSARRAYDWRVQADRFLTDLERWTAARQVPEPDAFYQKGMLFACLFDLSPHADLRARAARGLIDLMRRSNVGFEHPAFWVLPVVRLLESARGDSRRELLAAMEASGQPNLILYAHAERALPASSRSPASGAR